MIKRYYRDWVALKVNFSDLENNVTPIPEGARIYGCIFTDNTPWQDHFNLQSKYLKGSSIKVVLEDHCLRPGRLKMKLNFWWDNDEFDSYESATRVYDLGIELTEDPVEGGPIDAQTFIPVFATTPDPLTAERISNLEDKVNRFKPSVYSSKSQCVDRRIHKGLLNIRNNQGGVYSNERRAVKISLGRMKVGDVKTFDLSEYFDEASKPIDAVAGAYGSRLGHVVEYTWPMIKVTAVEENAAGFVQGNVFLYVDDGSPYVEIPKGGGKVRFISREDATARRLTKHDVPIDVDLTTDPYNGQLHSNVNYELQRYKGRGVSYIHNHRRRRPKWRRCDGPKFNGIFRVRYAANRGYKGDWKYFIIFESRNGRRIKWI